MNYRLIGRTGVKVSEVGIGCSGYWGNKNFSEEAAKKIILEAFERGVNFFDTGHNYCEYQAEPRLGKAISEIKKISSRDKVIISTKAGTTIGKAKASLGKSVDNIKNFEPSYIEGSIKRSIENLSCDYLDIFQLHGLPSNSRPDDPLLKKLLELKASGLIRSIGVNTHNLEDMNFVANNSDIFDMILIDYNVLQLDREPVIRKLFEQGIGVVAGTVLAQGHVIKGKLGSFRSMADLWYFARATLKPAGRTLMKRSKSMKEELLNIDGISSAQAAVAFVLDNEHISSCVVGTTKISNLIQLIEATEKKLPQSKIDSIRSVSAKIN